MVTQFWFRSGLLLLVLWACGRCVGIAGLVFGFSQAIFLVDERAEHDRAIADGPAGGVVLDEADRLADQGLVDVDRAIAPADIAVVAHPPHLVLSAIFRLAQDTVGSSRRRRVLVGRRGVAKRLMRTLFVVETLEGA